MNYNRFDHLRMLSSTLDLDAMDAELTRGEGGPSNSPEPTTDRRPRELSGRFIGDSSSLNTRKADHEPAQSGSEPRATTTHDLETLMEGGYHMNPHEGVLKDDRDDSRFSSVVFFEMISVASGLSSTSEIRYLPLVAMGGRADPRPIPDPVAQPTGGFISANPFGGAPNRQAQIQPQTAVASKPRPIGILAETKRYIDDVRRRRTLEHVVEPESEAASRTTKQAKGSTASVTEDKVSTAPGLWPARQIPVELFEMITRTLSHRDIRNMRLVSKEFESKTSGVLFKEVVVPFTTDLYDMIEEDASVRLNSMCMLQRSGISTSASDSPSTSSLGGASERSLAYQKTSENSSEHGLRVFEGFGPHMSKFGMRFEVTEADLITAPSKKVSTRHVEAYHGDYEWPPPGYARFGRLASLEKIADETPRMTAAFEKLKNVREIGLSLDSGLGFLSGPDKSHHDMIFEKLAAVFEDTGSSGHPTPDGAEKFWSCLRQSHSSFTSSVQLAETRLMACILPSDNDDISDLPTVCSTEYDDTSLWPSVKADGILSGMNLTAPVRGIFYTAEEDPAGANGPSKVGPSKVSLSPASLTSQQKQWILETGWAQSAFLDTYTLAIADNPQIFHQITRVTISKISSGLLAQLDREAFWKSLPGVKDVTLLVSPDWRTVCKDNAGCAITPSLAPSTALNTFYAVLRRVARLENLQRLRIGYTEGGENAKGMFARNSNVMPAPVAPLSQLLQPEPDTLSLAHIKDVVLLNCWISPRALLRLTSGSSATTLGKTLTLDSVSLSANTRPELQDWLRVNRVMDFRETCWPSLIYRLGKLVQHEPEDAETHSHSMTSIHSKEPARLSPYQRIDFKSCGYVYLQANTTFDQSALQLPPGLMQFYPDIYLGGHFAGHDTDWFRRRADQLRPHMLKTKDDYLGRIMPCLPANEVVAIEEWQMLVGPPDIYSESEEAEYDGLVRKGSGRFWGYVQTDEAAPSAFDRGFDG